MATWTREQEFNEAYIARVKRLREERGWTSEQMATALGVPPDRYRKYEYRSLLPHYLIEQFAAIVDRDVSYILTGRAFPPARRPAPTRKSA
jgi:transcriptional regulator with XRE-family HTH domain